MAVGEVTGAGVQEGGGTGGGTIAAESAQREHAGLLGKSVACSIEIGGVQCLIVPAADYEALRERAQSADERAPMPALRKPRDIARTLRDARRTAGISQRQLAERLGRSQSMVSQAERGSARLGERYLRAVLDACGQSDSWVASASREAIEDELVSAKLSPAEQAEERERIWEEQARRDWFRADVAGIDPETFRLVRIGSPRDRELRARFAWWSKRLDPLDDE